MSKGRVLAEALGASALVTAIVAGASFLPTRYVAFAVAVVFLFATWILVWRRDDDTVARYGLDFAGLVLPGRLDPRELVKGVLQAIAWSAAFAVVTFPLFFVGWRLYQRPQMTFSIDVGPVAALNAVIGQLAVIALPEEAFYRGYLQTRLGDVFERKVRLFGATIGPELVIASLVFAIAHVVTIRSPGRLAVFFPALLFGFLRARTGGVGASVAYHAACNLFSEALGRGYGVY